MTKKPHSIYVDEIVHARVSQMISNASGGLGSLAGFFAFIEEKAYAEFGPSPATPGVREYVNVVKESPDSDDPGKDRHELAASCGIATTRAWFDYLRTPLGDMQAYVAAWRAAAETLPWSDRSVPHVFSLWLLARRAVLWQAEPAVQPSAPLNHDLDFGSTIHELIHELHDTGRGQTLPSGPPQTHVSFFPIAWRRGRVDFFPRDRRPRSAPTSFYLDSASHTFFYTIFGNAFFTGAEAKLDRLLGDTTHWIDVTAEAQFLEHGTDLQRLAVPYYESPDEATLASLDQPFWRADRTQLGWVVDRYPTLRVAHVLGLGRARLDNYADDELAARFCEAYELPTLSPSVSHLYRIIRNHPSRNECDPTWNDPVEFHLFQVLREYLRSVLPPAEREDNRVNLQTIATLAQSWALPTTRALEAYGEADARKTASGDWELVRGRKRVLTMTNDEAYHAMWVLWSTLPPLRAYQPYVDALSDLFQALTGFDSWVEEEAYDIEPLAQTLKTRDRFTFATGPAVVADVVRCIRDDRTKTAQNPSPFRMVGFMAANAHPCTLRLREQVIAEMLSKTPDTRISRRQRKRP